MVKRFNEFISENKNSEYLYYAAFDWDDNILIMPTKIHMQKMENNTWTNIDITTGEFAKIRNDINWRVLDNIPDRAFSDFRDYGPRGDNAFLTDVISAITEQKFGPSWTDFIECITNGSLFAIITARGHESNIMKEAIKWIIDEYLTEDQKHTMYYNLMRFAYLFNDVYSNDYDKILKGKTSDSKLVNLYLDNCVFVGISCPSIRGDMSNPERAKEKALLDFQYKIDRFAKSVGLKAVIGFSDDDAKNVKRIEDLFTNLKKEQFPNIVKYVVKSTKDPKNITKKVRIVETSNQAPGTESSVLKFTQFGNMTGHLYPGGPDQRQDDYANFFKRQVKYLTKTSKDILGNKKRKRKRRIK